MKHVKVIEGFYEVKNVGKVVRQQKKMIKERKMVGAEVKIEDAYNFYVKNLWFKNQLKFKTRPVPGQKMVVIYYESAEVVVENISVADKVIKKAPAKLRSMFAALIPKKGKRKSGKSFSPAALFEIAFLNPFVLQIDEVSHHAYSSHTLAA